MNGVEREGKTCLKRYNSSQIKVTKNSSETDKGKFDWKSGCMILDVFE